MAGDGHGTGDPGTVLVDGIRSGLKHITVGLLMDHGNACSQAGRRQCIIPPGPLASIFGSHRPSTIQSSHVIETQPRTQVNKIMPSVDHSIKISLINKLQLPMSIEVSVNDQIKTTQHFRQSGDYVLEFIHDYQTQSVSSLQLHFQGQEQESKQITIREIKINNQLLQVNYGFYVPNKNQWWTNLDPNKLQSIKEKFLNHAGEMGWFGTMTYEYIDRKQPWCANDPWVFTRQRLFL